MKHLGHQSRKKEVYDGDMVVYSGIMGDFWGGNGGEKGGKRGPGDQLARPGRCREGAGRLQGGCREGARRVQGEAE